MSKTIYTIWCNATFPPRAMQILKQGIGPHRLVFPETLSASILSAGSHDPLLETADIAFGQPDASQVSQISRLKWVQLTTAGYTRFDNQKVRAAFAARGAMITNSSGVYAEPCAQHLVAMLLSLARQLPQSQVEQLGDRGWRSAGFREKMHLLQGQTAILLSFGAIARRVEELLRPFGIKMCAMRRNLGGDEPIPTFLEDQLENFLPSCDYLLNILPESEQTKHFINSARLKLLKPGAALINIGRGSTVDQTALEAALKSGHLAAAYLDVTDPEPLPKDHPLWSAPNCYITPHTAGGHADEFDRLVEHFLGNLRRYEEGESMVDRVIG